MPSIFPPASLRAKHTKERSAALFIKRTCGMRTAAVFLRNLGWTLPGALWALTGKDTKRMTGHHQITRCEWQQLGGLENPNLARKQSSKGWWTYWKRIN